MTHLYEPPIPPLSKPATPQTSRPAAHQQTHLPALATARTELFTSIETFYNHRRLRKHKIYGYLTPTETRQRHQHALAAQQSSVQDHEETSPLRAR